MQDVRELDGTRSPLCRRFPAGVGTLLPRDLSAPGQARLYLVGVLPGLGVHTGAIDSALLIASELVANAVRHGRDGNPRLLAHFSQDGTLTITVADKTPYSRLPAAVLADATEESGRGLFIVAALSTRWGHRPVGSVSGNGTAVWAEITGAAA